MTEIRNFNSKMGDFLIFDNWTDATISTEKSEEENDERLAQVQWWRYHGFNGFGRTHQFPGTGSSNPSIFWAVVTKIQHTF